MPILITGGAGFIGSNFVLDWLAQSDEPLINLDALTYAGNLENLASLEGDARHRFVHVSTDEVYGSLERSAPAFTKQHPYQPNSPYSASKAASQIRFVADRPGHDRRYAIDAGKIERELGWKPAETFESGIRKTVQWYLDHPDWVAKVQSGAYRDWLSQYYGEREAA